MVETEAEAVEVEQAEETPDPGVLRPAPGQDVITDPTDIETRDRDDITLPPPDDSKPDHEPAHPNPRG